MASRLASGIAFLIVCVAMFEVPSSLIVARGYSPWLGLGVGAAVFPFVPLGWHLVAERKPRAASSTTTGWKRLVYRTLVVAAIAFATMLVTARAHVRAALHDHLLWFLPDRTVWFPGDPPALGSRAMCEAFTTMENKCEEVAGDYAAMVKICMLSADAHHHSTIQLRLNIDVAQKCAIKTTSCDDYHECEYGRE
jgi:hypothetical protein